MITIIENEHILDTARALNRRDAVRLDRPTRQDSDEADEDFWARTPGVESLLGADGQRLCIGGSHYSWGPYPRNRRILADIALATGWGINKTRILERRCVQRAAKHHASVNTGPYMDLSNSNQPMHQGTPFTFQHISWSFLAHYIKQEVQELDATKMAAIKACVLDRYEANSKTGKKNLPVCPPGMSRISDDLPVTEADVKDAQDKIDAEERWRKAMHMQVYGPYIPPGAVTRQIKSFLASGNMSEEQFCKAIDVTETELQAFMRERKLRPQQESKVFHNAVPFFKKWGKGEGTAKTKKRMTESTKTRGVRRARK
ncbi:hypothetical protein GQ53DRAFT_745891 [Thozetella sp. PMI_491]|nr:hypothetical protein GQ53DRAFT_745891 [Thozetella sp. PMI_491]